MDKRDCIERFLDGPWKEMEMKTDNPESTANTLWKYLKERRKAMHDFNERVAITKKEKSVIVKKYKEYPEECTVTLDDGRKVLLKDLFDTPSEDAKRRCQILKEMAEISQELPSEEEIKSWNMSKADENLLLETLKVLKVKS